MKRLAIKGQKRLLFLGCEVLFREVCLLSATSSSLIDHRWLSQGLHDLGAEKMAARLQREIDTVPAGQYDAILLGFALCNNGVVGVSSAHTPMIIPKAHDCITFFLGSRTAYQACFDQNPGTYFYTSGWMERDDVNLEEVSDSIQDRLGLVISREEMVERYGEENAEYLMAEMGNLTQNYTTLLYIDTGVDPSGRFLRQAEEQATANGWSFKQMTGDLTLLKK